MMTAEITVCQRLRGACMRAHGAFVVSSWLYHEVLNLSTLNLQLEPLVTASMLAHRRACQTRSLTSVTLDMCATHNRNPCSLATRACPRSANPLGYGPNHEQSVVAHTLAACNA